jgi:ribosomal protein S18 acetylase RimI-like enzyme
MDPADFLKRTPWDSAIYGIETYELRRVSEDVLLRVVSQSGHYTAKVDPLASKKLLHDFGFYYCDTLVEPYCAARDLVRFAREDVAVSQDIALEPLLAICHGAFAHDRFHRDFNLERADADRRYDHWLEQLHHDGAVHGLLFDGRLAGFIALSANRMVLHAIAPEYRGRGLAKYLWSGACAHFFDRLGFDTLESSISTTNLPVLNLYASLGFRFRNATDVYHRIVGDPASP